MSDVSTRDLINETKSRCPGSIKEALYNAGALLAYTLVDLIERQTAEPTRDVRDSADEEPVDLPDLVGKVVRSVSNHELAVLIENVRATWDGRSCLEGKRVSDGGAGAVYWPDPHFEIVTLDEHNSGLDCDAR